MEAKHTPGPWAVSEDIFDNEGTLETAIRAMNGRAVPAVVLDFGENNPDMRLANARLVASAPDLLRELEMAHKIIKNALVVMTTPQKRKWGEINAKHHVDGDGITRANEREFVIQKAKSIAFEGDTP